MPIIISAYRILKKAQEKNNSHKKKTGDFRWPGIAQSLKGNLLLSELQMNKGV